MLIKDLNAAHAEYDAPTWTRLRAMYEGGSAFRKHIREFLPQHAQEPDARYQSRLKEASFENHVGPIIDFYTAWLFSMSFSVKARDKDTGEDTVQPDFYKTFHSDVGDERSLPAFIKDRTSRTLAIGASYTLLEKPPLRDDEAPPETLADFNKAGLDKIRLKTLEREQVIDWAYGEDGHYDWLVVHTECEVRQSPMKGGKLEVVEHWRVYDRETVSLFESRYEKGQRPSPETEASFLGTTPHGFLRVPVMKFELPVALRLGERAYEPQLEHFRLCSGLAYAIRLTCYAMPIVKLEDPEGAPFRMGTGYFIQLGVNDSFEWSAPPQAPFDVIQKAITARREELYRISHSMSLGVSNNAETVGRSAESKAADSATTRIILNALGQETCRFVEELYEMLSETRGETNLTWAIEGFSGYDTASAGSLISDIESANRIGIPSKQAKQSLYTKVAMALLPEADQVVKDQIRKEIAEHDFTFIDPMNAQSDSLTAKAELERAKAAAEPIKAKAAAKSASQPNNGGVKPPAPQQRP